MELDEEIAFLNVRFIYRADPSSPYTDYWSVMKLKERGGAVYGDCDDYTMTIFWLLSDGVLSFIWRMFFTKEYKIHRVLTNTRQYHIVGEYHGFWFDNWSRCALEREVFFSSLGHKYIKEYGRLQIAWYVLFGLFRRQ